MLTAAPDNYETKKILGSLYSVSSDAAKREVAKDHLKKVTSEHPDDLEAWIELAGILEETNVHEALSCYEKAADLLKENVSSELPPELLNNMAALHQKLGKFKEAKVS